MASDTLALSGQSVSEQEGHGDGSIRCPLLLSHLETRNPRRRIAIIDTASASARSLRAYSGLTGRFVFLGIGEDLDPEDPHPMDAMRAGLAHFGTPSADLMLLWDQLNYLPADQLPGFADTVRRHLRPGARLHMLIASSQRRVAWLPGQFEILPGWGGVVANHGEGLREAPRFTPWQIEKAFAGFEVERSVLLRNGMQEYLLRLRMQTAGIEESG